MSTPYDNTLPNASAAGQHTSQAGGNALAILRKINLSVDIATQAELISVYNELSGMIQKSGTDWQEADQALSTALKDWAKGSELSGALHNEITAETDRAETAEEAIRADLSNNYVVTVEKQTTAESGYSATYYVKQGGTKVGDSINIPKDLIVKSAELCTVTTADTPYEGAKVGDLYIDFTINVSDASETAQHIYLPVNDLVDVYTGGTTAFATVSVDSNRVITTNISADLISAAAVAEVRGESTDTSADYTIYGNRDYTDKAIADALGELSAGIDAQGDTLVSANVADGTTTVKVGATSDLTTAVANANSALQSIAKSGDFINVTEKSNNSQTVSLTTATLTAGTAGLAEATDVKSYVDTLVGTPLSSVKVNGSALTVTDRTVDLSVATGTTNGTLKVNGTDIAVAGLGSAAYTLSSAYDKAGDAAALQTAVKNAVDDARFDAAAAADDYQDIEDIIEDLVKVRKTLGALKALNVTLTPAAS